MLDRDGAVRVPAGAELSADDLDEMDWFVEGVTGDSPP